MQLVLRVFEEMAVGENQTLASSEYSPESAILGSELRMYIRRQIEALSPRLREPFILHFYQDMSYPDKRRLAYRCRMKLVLGEEGKQTKKIVNAVLKLAPHSADAHQLKAEYYRLRGKSAKSVAILKKFTEEYPNNPHGWCYYARCLSKNISKFLTIKNS